MNFEVNYFGDNCYIYAPVGGYYLWHDGTLHLNNANSFFGDDFTQGWWHTKSEAEKFLKNWLKEKEMSSVDDRLVQINAEIKALEVEKQKLILETLPPFKGEKYWREKREKGMSLKEIKELREKENAPFLSPLDPRFGDMPDGTSID